MRIASKAKIKIITERKMFWEKKAIRVLYPPTILAFPYEPEGTYSNLKVKLEAVIIEVSTVQMLRLRAM